MQDSRYSNIPGLITAAGLVAVILVVAHPIIEPAVQDWRFMHRLTVERVERGYGLKVAVEKIETPAVAGFEAPAVERAAVSEPVTVLPSDTSADAAEASVMPAATSSANTIAVAKMGVHTAILEGPTVATLNQGLWRIPGTSNPERGGNMVIAGHRYKWLPPSTKTFWDIDKVEVGDTIEVTWNGTLYRYEVRKTSIVTPDRVDILRNTPEAKLTLFSCTPKFSSDYRLVVEAYPI